MTVCHDIGTGECITGRHAIRAGEFIIARRTIYVSVSLLQPAMFFMPVSL
jgi:hypothetical protein